MMKNSLILLLSTLLTSGLYAQTRIYSNSYDNHKQGVYELKSLIPAEKPLIIQPQTEFNDSLNVGFIYVDKNVIALFDRINDKGDRKPVGVLTKTSIVKVDTIYYNEIYVDTTKGWFVTFNVWYAVKINGTKYYTDYQIHDRIIYKADLSKFRQKFLLIAQSTGYDFSFAVGYPNNFFISILNQKNEIVYSSKILDFDYGDEFWSKEFLSTRVESRGFVFTIKGMENGAKKDYSAEWTGKELIKK